MLLLSFCLLFFHLKISQLLASVFFPLSPWAANCPHLSNLTPVCNFTFLILYSLSLFVFFTAFSHDIAVFSEVQAKVMQLLYGKTQPVIGDSQAPQGSLPELEFKQSLFLYFFLKMDISYSIAIICLSILLSAIKKKKKSFLPIHTICIYTFPNTSRVISFILKWHLQSFPAQLFLWEPRCSFWDCKWLGKAGSNPEQGTLRMWTNL